MVKNSITLDRPVKPGDIVIDEQSFILSQLAKGTPLWRIEEMLDYTEMLIECENRKRNFKSN